MADGDRARPHAARPDVLDGRTTPVDVLDGRAGRLAGFAGRACLAAACLAAGSDGHAALAAGLGGWADVAAGPSPEPGRPGRGRAVRIVGGEWRGRPLATPAGRATRPTSDKVREAVFDVLGSWPAPGLVTGPVAGQAVLDLFAGSGALGLEALSRGAASCTFVEHDRAALRALRRNLAGLGLTSAGSAFCRVLAGDARRVLQADARRGSRYTLVFADPPYDSYAGLEPVLARLLGPLLAPSAVLVIETAAATTVALPWRVVRVKRYGDTRVTFLAARAGDQDEESATMTSRQREPERDA